MLNAAKIPLFSSKLPIFQFFLFYHCKHGSVTLVHLYNSGCSSCNFELPSDTLLSNVLDLLTSSLHLQNIYIQICRMNDIVVTHIVC